MRNGKRVLNILPRTTSIALVILFVAGNLSSTKAGGRPALTVKEFLPRRHKDTKGHKGHKM